MVLPLFHNQNLKKVSTLFLRLCQEKSLRNSTRFHGMFFELEIQKIFTTGFFLKTITQALQSALLKDERKNLKKMQAS